MPSRPSSATATSPVGMAGGGRRGCDMNLPAILLMLFSLSVGAVCGYTVGHHDASQAARVEAGNRVAGR